jgi:hypothetical protein
MEFLVCGDTNTDYLLESNCKKHLPSLLTTYNLSHTVNFATWMQNESSTAIDNIFVDNSWLGSTITVPLLNGLSDHDAQLLTINNIYAAIKKVPLKQRTRIINSETLTNFQSLLKQETWQPVYQTHDTNNMFNSFQNTFLRIFEASFPVSYRSTKEKRNDWITQGIKISCKRKSSLYTLTRNSNDLKAKAHYMKYCKILKESNKRSKKAILW